ncbi:hypothetical protein SELMODRAFT_421866 [Selaginella moellendorffii]|uniref:Uncharacterized protein n=1 Tax=Selaginella moellendorffii TaxID=88036 RepID=D8SGL4_SELML|nr:hypothetical protein SELMODRAFT_421866 [Selaginella moellendorffii]
MKSFVTFILVLAVISSVCNAQDLSFTATTPGLTKGKPNTFIGTTGDEIASSLLASKTPAMLWGSVPAITNEYTAKIDGDWGGSEDLKLKVTMAPDSSGTQFVFTDNYGRKSAVDQAARRFLLGGCKEEAGKGAIGGAITGVLGAGGYSGLGPLAPFCIIGVMGVGTLKNGRLDFSEIYAFGHRDRRVTSSTWNYPTQRPLSSRACISCQRCSKLVVESNSSVRKTFSILMAPLPVTRIPGLFNPLTLQGTIVVNGVAASVHSDWFLDTLFDTFGLTAYLPAAYQAILSPARLLYTLLGPNSYLALYKWIDARINVAEFGTDNGGKIAAGALLACGIASLLSLKKTPNFA